MKLWKRRKKQPEPNPEEKGCRCARCQGEEPWPGDSFNILDGR